MMCVGRYEIKTCVGEVYREKNKCICTDGMLENGCMCLY